MFPYPDKSRGSARSQQPVHVCSEVSRISTTHDRRYYVGLRVASQVSGLEPSIGDMSSSFCSDQVRAHEKILYNQQGLRISEK